MCCASGARRPGKNNYPAPAAGSGLECDKLSKAAAEAHFAGMMGKVIADIGPGDWQDAGFDAHRQLGSRVAKLDAAVSQEFRRLRGYDPLPYLPVMTGRVVDSLEVSERFLWDIRRTVCDLLVENYAVHMRELAHAHGLRLSIEAYDAPPCDDMTYGGQCG